MKLNSNLMSMGIYRNYSKSLKLQSIALNRISTGEKITSSKDNPNGIGKSELLRLQIRGIDMAQRNLQDSASMLQNVDSGLDSIGNALNRMKELTIQAGSANTIEDKEAIQGEIEQLKAHIDSTAKNTEFNGKKLLHNNEVSDNNIPNYIVNASGANKGDNIYIPTYNLSLDNMRTDEGDTLKDIDIRKEDGVDKALEVIDEISKDVISIRSKYGALQNRIESSKEALGNTYIALTNSDSSLRDADLAEEMVNFAKEGILIDSSRALMAQSNKFPQDILRVLERVK